MPLQSDLSLPPSTLHLKLHPTSISPQTHTFNTHLIAQTTSGPKWYEIGAEQYRRMRWEGKTAMPRPVVLDGDDEELILKEDEGRRVPVRIFRPSKDDGKGEVKARGVFCHIHGGGWVLQSEKYQVG